MSYLKDVLTLYENLDIDEISEEVIKQNEVLLEDLQRDQMMHGLNRHGEKLGEYRSEAYAEFKHRLNPLPGFPNVDLRKSGAFQARITAHTLGNEIIIESTDEKNQDLIDKYDPFGLSPEYAQKFIDALRPEFLALIKDRL